MHNKGADKSIPRTFMVPAETIRMGVLLQTHCKPIKDAAGNDTKLWRYVKGWDDTRVAKETGDRLDEGHTRRLRKSLEMPLEKVQPRKDVGSHIYKTRFNAIDKRLDELVTSQSNIERGLDDRMDAITHRMQELALKNKALEAANADLIRTVGDFTRRFALLELALSLTPDPAPENVLSELAALETSEKED